jgi:hypothetical protein
MADIPSLLEEGSSHSHHHLVVLPDNTVLIGVYDIEK